MSSIVYGHIHIWEPGKAFLSAARSLAARMGEALRRPTGQGMGPRETYAEICRRLGRDVPANLRRDLGLDPDVL